MKTYEQLMSCKTEDLMSPNPVFCYGGGGTFDGIGRYMLSCGINIVGIIDANKTGSIEVCGRKLSYFSIDEVIRSFGQDVIVIITIADEAIIQQVERELVQRGFDENKIFDLNLWSWLTVPAEKSYCRHLGGFMQIMLCALTTCCNVGKAGPFFSEWYVRGRPVEQSVENFLAKRLYYIEQSKRGRIPLYCKNCKFLSEDPDENCDKVNTFNIGDNSVCNADCVYCAEASSIQIDQVTPVGERYDTIFKTYNMLRERGLLDKRVSLEVASGEITINPYRRQIYDIARKLPGNKVVFFSNGFLYDPDIADILAHNKNASIVCDLDAGTPETYIKVKGFNKFNVVKENLKRYARHGTVIIKYIVLPDWNDSDADYQGTAKLLNDLEIKQLMLSPEFQAVEENDRATMRKVLYATARLMAILEDNGIDAIMPPTFWHKEHEVIAKRFCRELHALNNTSQR